MCLMYYLVADRPLPSVTNNDSDPRFAVTPATGDTLQRVRTVTTFPYAYFLASWQGCSCGFTCDISPEVEQELSEIPDERTRSMCLESLYAGRNSVGSLARYLSEQLPHGPLMLYVAHAGSEGAPILHYGSISPEFFTTSVVPSLQQDSLLTVRQASSTHTQSP